MPARAFNLANSLTVLRILLTIPFGYLIWEGKFGPALIVFAAAGISDYADGFVARRFHQETQLGRLLDPIADKLLTTVAFVALTFHPHELPSMPLWLAISVIGRDVIIILGSIVIYYTDGFSQFKPSLAGKINTFLEILIIGLFLFVNTVGSGTGFLPYAYVIVLVSVLVSGVGYIKKGIDIHRAARRPSLDPSQPVEPRS